MASKRLNKFLSSGTEVLKVFTNNRYKEISVLTLTFEVDGLPREITLEKSEAKILLNTLTSLQL